MGAKGFWGEGQAFRVFGFGGLRLRVFGVWGVVLGVTVGWIPKPSVTLKLASPSLSMLLPLQQIQAYDT